ncbi:hypothetical protein [Pseudogemmobacter faecipullorum]|uniref:Uncharacterized protein n=1 Tax=Pseudogemmobacter faecipullorum TaxID=2755041 RepID=A0ABS8CS22_9RHOB|nr:hypothetical protein [Pseudogemmobacter faecipullorum]MCB5412163.1 hypothetical protein [Pseudogemmobacter faecipullorum]
MSSYRPAQIELARQMLTQPDLSHSAERRALNERIARHVLKSTQITCDRSVITVPKGVFIAGLAGRNIDHRGAV